MEDLTDILNLTSIDVVKFNQIDISVIKFNGVIVWEKIK